MLHHWMGSRCESEEETHFWFRKGCLTTVLAITTNPSQQGNEHWATLAPLLDCHQQHFSSLLIHSKDTTMTELGDTQRKTQAGVCVCVGQNSLPKCLNLLLWFRMNQQQTNFASRLVNKS